MRSIFISYRREDSEGQAGRLLKDLADHFGQDAVFMDVAAIAAGRDFRRVIDENVGTCGVLLALIGKAWLTAQDASGQRRLDDPADLVRLETASALKRDIPVVPVLVHGALMPRADQLPLDLAELAYRNGVELTHARWDSDVQVLIKALEPFVQARSGHAAAAVPTAAARQPSHGRSVAVAVGALIAVAAAFGVYRWLAVPRPVATPASIASAGPDVPVKPPAGMPDAAAPAMPDTGAAAARAEHLARAKGKQEALAASNAADKRTAETVAANNAAAEKVARDKAAEKALADRAATDKLAADRALADKAAAEKLETDRDRAAGVLNPGQPTSAVTYGQPIANRRVMLINAQTGKCLTIAGGRSTDNNVKALQFDCDGDPSRSWSINATGSDVYQISNVQTGKCLTIAGGRSIDNNVEALQFNCDGDPSRTWRITASGGGVYQISNVQTGKCLTIAGGRSTDNNLTALQFNCDTDPSRTWRIRPAGQ